MAQLMKYFVSSRFLIISLVLIFNSVTIALANDHTETYVTYQNVTKIVESVKSRSNCGYWSCSTEYFRDYDSYVAVESVTATRCQRGWSPYPRCDEIDECKEGISGCEHICSNAVSSYFCSCHAGYRLASNGRSCGDIDECTAQLDNCTVMENFTCENTIGGYQCVCKTGFEQVGPSECHDINECETSTNNCTLYENLICENVIGSYKCHSDSRWMSEATVRLVIIITVGAVGLILIIITVVCFAKCAMKRMRNKQANNEDMAAENVYCNVSETTIVTSSESDISPSQASSEIVYEVVADVKRLATNTNTFQLTSSKNVYVEAANVCKKKQTKPKINDFNTQEKCRSTTASCSIPEEKTDLKIGEVAMDSTYQELSAVAEMENVYEPIKKKP